MGYNVPAVDSGRVVLGRLEILELLGEGQTGRVYQAYDRVLKTEVAVKEFSEKWLEGGDVTFRHELRFLSRLNHPSLVKVFDLLVDEPSGRHYLVQELARGEDAGRYVRNASWDERRQVLVQLLRGLEYLHQNGVIHLDIKPSNVLVHDLGRGPEELQVRILDFGIASEIGRYREKGVVSGTFPYVAPEVVWGDAVDGRADLFSLGMFFWEAVRGGGKGRSITYSPPNAALPAASTGCEYGRSSWRPPSGGSLQKEVKSSLEWKAPPADDFPDGTPADFREILTTLLQPHPQNRFHSANHAIRRINKRLGSDHPLEPGRLRLPDLAGAVLLGRQAELAELERLFDEFLENDKEVRTIAMVGDRDFGKTAVLLEFKRRVQVRDHQVVDLCRPGDGVPELFDRLILAEDEKLLDPHLPFLKSILPSRFAHARDPEPLDGGPMAEQIRTREKLAEVLAVILACRPVVLLLDDALDRAGLLDLLAYCARHRFPETQGVGAAGRHKLFAVLTVRTRSEIPSELPPDGWVELRPWTSEEVGRVLQNLLALDAIPARIVRAFHEQSDGVPGLVVERLRLLVGRVFQPGENVDAQIENLSPSDFLSARDLPARYRELLPDPALPERRVLEWLSLSPKELGAREIAEVDPSLSPGLGFALRRLQEQGWIRAGLLGLRPANEPRRETVLREVPVEVRRSMHRRLAEKMQGGETGSVLETADAFFRGGDPLQGFALAEQELRTVLRLNQAERILPFLETHIESAAGLPPARNRAYHRLLGEAYLRVADFPKAIQILKTLVTGTGETAQRVDVKTLLAQAYRYGGRLSEASEAIRAAKLLVGRGSPEEPSLDALLADVLLEQADYEGAAQIAQPYLSGGRPCGLDEVIAFRHVMAKVHFYKHDYERAIPLFEQNCAETERTGRPARHALSLNSLGAAHICRGNLTEALACLQSCSAISREIGDLRTMGLAHSNLALAHFREEKMDLAAQNYEKAIATFRKISDRATEARTLFNLGALHLVNDDLNQARDVMDETVRLARDLAMTHIEGKARLQLAECHLRAGTVDDALRESEQAEALFRKVGAQEDILLARLRRIEIGVGRDAPELAAIEVEKCEKALEGKNNPHVEVWCFYVRGLLLRGKKPAEARKCVEAALSRMQSQVEVDFSLKRKVLSLLSQLPPPASTVTRPEQGSACSADDGMSATEAWTPPPAVPPRNPEGLAWLAIARKINSAVDVQDVLSEIVSSLVAFTGAERGFLLQKQGKALTVRVARTDEPGGDSGTIDSFSQTVAEETLEAGKPVITLDAMSDPRFKESHSVHQLQLRSVMCVPLLLRGEAVGALYLDSRLQSGRFGEHHLPALQALTDLAAVALYKAQLIAQTVKDQREIRRVMRELRQAKERIEQLNAELEESNRSLREKVAHQEKELEATQQRVEFLVRQEKPRYPYDRIVGSSPAMRRILPMVDRAVESSLPVLIFGESGTGKELVARAVHFNSIRKQRAFVPVNCAAVPHDLFESELFGHAKGAFTGADRERPGLFEAADGGTLFLDEIGDLPPPLQPKLLRAVQEGSIRRVGDSREIKVDVRLIAATNLDLKEMIRLKKFREDLYYRLRVFRVSIPPLRERREDIPQLARHFLSEIARRDGRPPKEVSEAALRLLTRHHWPGNVRELENAIQNAYALSDGDTIGIESLRDNEDLFAGAPAVQRKEGQSLREAELELRKHLIEEALRESGGNISAAARSLKVDRNLLTRWARVYGLRTANK